jgi:outer membrane lipoprotein-sorting protein
MKKYIKYKTLYIDKNTGKPTKMEIKDIAQKVLVYILYNEIKINNLQKEDILAFKLKQMQSDI